VKTALGAALTLACTALACGSGGGAAPADASTDGPPVADGGADASADEAGSGLGLIDRAGRPLIAVLLVPTSHRDEYNGAATFDAPLSRPLQDALSARLQAFDVIALDGGADPVDWPVDGGAHPLVPMLALDALLVDTALPCTSADGGFAASYLDIEREIFSDIFQAGAAHTTCGGRTPSDDVVDTTLALLVTRDRDGGPSVTQGVAGPSKDSTTRFPYFAPPNSP
jgi:hypothetical protein